MGGGYSKCKPCKCGNDGAIDDNDDDNDNDDNDDDSSGQSRSTMKESQSQSSDNTVPSKSTAKQKDPKKGSQEENTEFAISTKEIASGVKIYADGVLNGKSNAEMFTKFGQENPRHAKAAEQALKINAENAENEEDGENEEGEKNNFARNVASFVTPPEEGGQSIPDTKKGVKKSQPAKASKLPNFSFHGSLVPGRPYLEGLNPKQKNLMMGINSNEPKKNNDNSVFSFAQQQLKLKPGETRIGKVFESKEARTNFMNTNTNSKMPEKRYDLDYFIFKNFYNEHKSTIDAVVNAFDEDEDIQAELTKFNNLCVKEPGNILEILKKNFPLLKLPQTCIEINENEKVKYFNTFQKPTYTTLSDEVGEFAAVYIVKTGTEFKMEIKDSILSIIIKFLNNSFYEKFVNKEKICNYIASHATDNKLRLLREWYTGLPTEWSTNDIGRKYNHNTGFLVQKVAYEVIKKSPILTDEYFTNLINTTNKYWGVKNGGQYESNQKQNRTHTKRKARRIILRNTQL